MQGTPSPAAGSPLYIRVHESDNVAIIVNSGGLPAGSTFHCGLVLKEHVPQGHKVALKDLAQDEAIIRYGEIIGYAMRPIEKGSWIEESLVRMPVARLLRPCRSRPGFPFRCQRSRAIPSRVTAIPTARWVPRTC